MKKLINNSAETIAYNKLKDYCRLVVPFTNEELNLIDDYFELTLIKKNDCLLESGKICRFIGFIAEGVIRHFHIKDGEEKTCDISFENSFVTDFQSFSYDAPSLFSLKAMEETTVLYITRVNLFKLYKACGKYETLGRMMAEKVAQRATEIAMSLSSDKPEQRYRKLLSSNPELVQRVPQKYIANFLGISPESLSRIRKRITSLKKS